MAKSPLQIVKDKYGSKDKLIEAAAKVLEPAQGEEKEEFEARLKFVSNAKLLHLVDVAERITKLGGKPAVAQAVADMRKQGKDKDFVRKLGESSMSTLLDMHRSLSRAAKQAN